MEWIHPMPKIELHAHLNGSIRDSTLLELARVLGEKGVVVFSDVEDVIQKNDRSLARLRNYLIFSFVKVIEDFALENVVYLELRTTPKVTQSFAFSFKVKLALEMRNVGVVGIDLSGKPLVGEW
ncbi:unnamed protein product [Eruca vesicaria subsp. sativa]|uniref:Adenosine deaminase n=1 Tax=Eruca vesicaria subsp. sativa TaxID=29727 RepID=A0ABC8LE94_ERUVS|nr:unnamed protein product [Eruca vesicaria subsp. sativa]